MRAHGVDVRLRASVEEILRGADGSVRGVRLEAGDEIPCELVVSAIGVVPNTKFLEGSGLALSKGGAIEVDAALKASAPDVWAAGDCANVTWADGSRRPEQLWYTARDQGRVAARVDARRRRRLRPRAPGTTRPSSSTSSGRRRAGCRSRSNWDDTPIAPGARRAVLVPARARAARVARAIVVEGRARGRLQHARARAGTTSRSCDWIHERRQPRLGARAPAARRSSTRSSCRGSASSPARSPD